MKYYYTTTMKIIATHLFFSTLTFLSVSGGVVRDEVKIIERAAADIDLTNKAIKEKVKSLHEKSVGLRHMEKDIQKQADALMAEHKKLVTQKSQMQKDVELLDDLKKMGATSIHELEDMIKQEDAELKQKNRNIIGPKRVSLRKMMGAVKLIRGNNLELAEELGDDIEKNAAHVKERNTQLRSKYDNLDHMIAVGAPKNV